MQIESNHTPSNESAPESDELRSAYGSMPGEEFPAGVYFSVIGAFAWMIGIAWLAFASRDGLDLDLTMVTVLAQVFFGIPLAMHHTATRSARLLPARMAGFLNSHVDTWTGEMPAGQAWLEVLLIPAALAVAATLIGSVYVFVA
jgi:hypothetical protein